MTYQKLFIGGLATLIVAILCCFTPLLVILLPTLGLAAWVSNADLILFPLIGFSAAVTLFAATRMGKGANKPDQSQS